MKEQAEEMDLKEIFLTIKNQQNLVIDVQKHQEEMQRKQQNFIIATVQKSIATEAKATQKLMMDREERIMEQLSSNRLANGVNERVTMARSSVPGLTFLQS